MHSKDDIDDCHLGHLEKIDESVTDEVESRRSRGVGNKSEPNY